MAQILVMAINKTHADPDKDRRGCYKRGYPVVVMSDSHTWGRDECLPLFVVVKLPGVDHLAPQLRRYISTEDEPDPDDASKTRLYRRREWTIDLDDLPAPALHTVNTEGVLVVKCAGYHGPYDVTWGQFRKLLRSQKTSQRETGEL